MSTRQPSAHIDAPGAVPDSWRALYFVAGAAAIGFVALMLVALALDFIAPPPESGGAATLEFIAENKSIYVAEQILWTLPNILAVVVFAALFVAIPRARNLALLGTVIGGSSWALFLASPVTSRGSLVLVTLSDQYSTAAPAGRDAFSAAAEALIAQNTTPSLVGSLSAAGIVLVAAAMKRSSFPSYLTWLGVAAGAAGVVAEVLRFVAPGAYSVYGLLLWAWFLGTGVALLRLGSRSHLIQSQRG